MSDERILNAALAYARAGWPVMPLAGVKLIERVGSVCACWLHEKCVSPAKHPLTKNGLFDATTDEAEILSWDRRYATWNLGLRTGVLFDVLDIDGSDGLQSYEDVLEQAGVFVEVGSYSFDGPIAATGRGLHLYVRPTGFGNSAHLRPGIDFRGDGGYVVAPPSLHINGTRYRWTEKGVVADAPDWMQRLVEPDPNRCLYVLKSGECGRLDPHGHRGGVVYPAPPVLLEV